MRHVIVSTLALCLGLAPLTSDAAAPEAKAENADKGAAKDRILGALDLPIKAHALRKAGADEKEIKAGLKIAKEKKLGAKDTAELLDAAARATKDHGPVDNFGAFVQSQLDAGLRGKDLAEAIRKEHQARGKKGKGEGKGEGKGPDDKGKPDDAGKPEDAAGGKPEDKGGKPEDAGQEGKGPPDDKGKPEDKGGGKPEDAAGGKPEDKGGKPEAKAEDKGGKPEAKAEDKGKGK